MRIEILILIICGYFVCMISAENNTPQIGQPNGTTVHNGTNMTPKPNGTTVHNGMNMTPKQNGTTVHNGTNMTPKQNGTTVHNGTNMTPKQNGTTVHNGTNKTHKHHSKNKTGLRCYACASTGGNNECEDYNTYKKAMEGKGNERIKKNCSEKYSVACFIETYEIHGATVSHIRGCSDDIHYSFFANLHQNKTSPYERFNDLKPDNETACVWDNLHLVCLTKCNNNFCNGPILEEVNASTVIKLSSILMFAAVLLYKIF
ncbi:uncharacterized protein LOC132745662 [Ruditapes philippinarum]|uniref:uncharacterized protein LOC132745662 n=1 Tax=Ruditapes philippinarum TaxID=129788 RepID=UPI00295B83D4|nr:uncharacterized protein LOC132745662 [Ruditapes philippinarum]